MILIGSKLNNLGIIFSAALLITSCGGGGGGGGSTPAAATITSISPLGMVQNASPSAISLTGTNFASGMTISVTDNLGGAYTVGAVNAATSSLITTTVTIPTAPAARYVTVALKSSSGTTLASTVLGVASVSKVLQSTASNTSPATTDIQYIFNNSCSACHGSSGNLDMSTKTLSANNLIQTLSNGPNKCTNRFRVQAGDPRGSSSFLIDKLTNSSPCGGGSKMTGNPTLITQTEIDAITEWIAGGAH